MISFYNIFTVAKIEVRTLLRSWFFRIFSGIAIIFLGFWDFASLSKVTHSPWAFRGISSTIPYISIMFLNSVQAVIAVFLASDFLKRDKKLDTTEVVYMRSMTNGDYVLGKTFGILFVFLILNVMVLALSLIMQLILAEVPVAWMAYLIYPLVISLPTLVFILGLSFFLMVLIRNQAVTFIVILGYIATTLFFLAGRFNALFDYMAYNVPLMYSSITGFSDTSTLLLHRGIYFVLGMSLISFTIILLKRLPQSRAMTGLSRISAFVLLALAAVMMVAYTGNIRSGVKFRREMVSLGNELSEQPVTTPVSCDIDIVHDGSRISAEASLKVINDTPSSIDRVILRLNPGLEVEQVLSGEVALRFEREKHILYVNPAETIDPGETLSFSVSYSGTIDEDACYPDILEKDRMAALRLENAGMVNIGKRYSFVSKDYILLTPETLWYPAAGPGYSSEHPENHRRDFIDFSLDVTTTPDLKAVSQGYAEKTGEGKYRFKPESLLPSLTLSIGDFEYRSIEVDSVEYGLY
ncbi:MAG: ABC transporter permease, partial [Bacteroidales bacterium]|nr:ABC transporter permease [Candidatus Latescibacterota bacterium]